MMSEKWLGKDMLGCLSIDGKGTRDQMAANVARWISASGRNITQPGKRRLYQRLILSNISFQSHDSVL